MAIFVIVILLFIGVCLYGIFMPKYMVKHGRQVDARVISCEEKKEEDENGEEEVYYEVSVDFYGLKGETIVKTFESENAYREGEVLRSRYLDKRDYFLENADKDVEEGSNKGLWAVIGILLAILAVVLFVSGMMDEEGELPDFLGMVTGYIISILFMGLGILGIVQMRKKGKAREGWQTLQGTQIDYIVEQGDGDEGDICYPVYEYLVMGEPHRYCGRTGGSSKKYRTAGRKVHILRNPHTGEVICREDEEMSYGIVLTFGGIGLLVFCILLGISSGVLGGGEGAGIPRKEEQITDTQAAVPVLEMYYMHEAANLQACSYAVDIYDDLSGRLLLFPVTPVSGRGIRQEIPFALTEDGMRKLSGWMAAVDEEALSHSAVSAGEDAVRITFYIAGEDGERRGGSACYGADPVYTELSDLIREIVPGEVWEEMTERESAYYREEE